VGFSGSDKVYKPLCACPDSRLGRLCVAREKYAQCSLKERDDEERNDYHPLLFLAVRLGIASVFRVCSLSGDTMRPHLLLRAAALLCGCT
jgi:hypothetical protein